MTQISLDLEPVFLATLTMLRTATSKSGEWGRSPSPAAGQTQPVTPYFILYGPVDDFRWGTLGEPEVYGRTTIQVTSVGIDARQATWLADKIRYAMRNTAITPTGVTVGYQDHVGTFMPITEGNVVSLAQRFMLSITSPS